MQGFLIQAFTTGEVDLLHYCTLLWLVICTTVIVCYCRLAVAVYRHVLYVQQSVEVSGWEGLDAQSSGKGPTDQIQVSILYRHLNEKQRSKSNQWTVSTIIF